MSFKSVGYGIDISNRYLLEISIIRLYFGPKLLKLTNVEHASAYWLIFGTFDCLIYDCRFESFLLADRLLKSIKHIDIRHIEISIVWSPYGGCRIASLQRLPVWIVHNPSGSIVLAIVYIAILRVSASFPDLNFKIFETLWLLVVSLVSRFRSHWI